MTKTETKTGAADSIPMPSAKLDRGRYEVIGTSTGCVVTAGACGTDHPSWSLHSDGRLVRTFGSKREALIYCQEHPEL